MSAMETAVQKMLMNLIPEEVMKLISPENVKAVADKINGEFAAIKQQLDRIEANQITLAQNQVIFADELRDFINRAELNAMASGNGTFGRSIAEIMLTGQGIIVDTNEPAQEHEEPRVSIDNIVHTQYENGLISPNYTLMLEDMEIAKDK